MRLLISMFLIFASLSFETSNKEVVQKLEMHLSAFGVESDAFPEIDVLIDFSKDTGICNTKFYNPDYKPGTYTLSKTDLAKIQHLLKDIDLKILKKEYKVNEVDQAKSTIIFYTNKTQYTIEDYGLQGEQPLPQIYDIVYKPIIKKY